MCTSKDFASPTVIFVHGFPLDHRLWSEQRVGRFMAVTLPGFGQRPLATPGGSMAAYAEAISEEMDRAGIERAVLCGLSMGGYILFECWRRFPQRIAALIFCDTRAEADTPEVKAGRQESIRLVQEGRRQELLEGFLPKLLAADSLQRAPLVELVRAMGRDASDQGLIDALQAMHDRLDSCVTLPTIHVPTLVVVGHEDHLTPLAMARTIHQGVRDSQLVEIARAGHLAPLENPQAFNEALAPFLKNIKHNG